MARKYNVNKINLRIEDIIPYDTTEDGSGSRGIVIQWSSSIGWGEYTIHFNEDGENDELVILGDSEAMDVNEDKAFISKLMELLVEQIIIER